MRQMSSIQIIKDVLPINGADAIELVQINWWQCVSKKWEFKKWDFCVYFEIDSLLPDNEYFSFLSKWNKLKTMHDWDKIYTWYKLKTIRLRWELSQWLALPIHIFKEFHNLENLYEGLDVSDMLWIIKYEAPISECLSWLMRWDFPFFIPKTDEERIQNINFDKFWKFDYYVTEKLEWSSITIYKNDWYFWVCSRNMDLLEWDNAYWNVVKKYPLLINLEDWYAIQWELIWPWIQWNIYKLNNVDFRVYNVYSIIDKQYLSLDDMLSFIKKYDLKFVPLLDINNIIFKNKNINSNLLISEWNSILNSSQEREGIVIRSLESNADKKSFKIISNKYLLNS